MSLNPEIESVYLKGLEALTGERFSEALEFLEQIPAARVEDPVMLNDLALARMAAGEIENALSLLSEIEQSSSPHPFVKINSFYCRMIQGLSPMKAPEPAARIRNLVRRDDSQDPKVSVIMTTFNRPEMIRESLESVLAQTFKGFELLVVNDGGNRAVEKTLEGYPDPRVVYILSEHGGLSSALNVGLSQARGEWIAYIDDDDVFYPDHLETLITFLESHPGAEAAYTDMYRAYQRKQGNEYRVVKRVLDYGRDMDRMRLRGGSIIPNRNPLMHHRKCMDEVGTYHEGLKYTMDWDFCLRLARRYELHHVRKITGEFRTRDDSTQMTSSSGAERNRCRNLILYLNGISPLTGRLLRSARQGDGSKLVRELGRILEIRNGMIEELELRKLWMEPYYALFYTLGKLRKNAGDDEGARAGFASACRLAPHEVKNYFAWIRSWL